MVIKITKNSQGQGYYHLVESHRVNGKPKQRTLLSLGKVGEDRLDELLSAISRHKEVFGILDLANPFLLKTPSGDDFRKPGIASNIPCHGFVMRTQGGD